MAASSNSAAPSDQLSPTGAKNRCVVSRIAAPATSAGSATIQQASIALRVKRLVTLPLAVMSKAAALASATSGMISICGSMAGRNVG